MSAELSTAIYVAVITGAFSVIGNLIIAHVQNKANRTDRAVRDQQIDDQIQDIRTRLDEHNNYGKKWSESTERMANIEKDVAVIKTDIEWLRKETEK